MYKLILVDDEQEVRKGILEKIEWAKCGFEILGEAGNGIEALEIAEKTVPDVVITDIKMPFMDGLVLSERLMEKFPATKVVILTGFDEFEYAKEAIRCNVIEYALKPISSKELTQILQKIKTKMDFEISNKKDIDRLKEYYIKSLPLLRGNFLCTLVSGTLDVEEIYEKIGLYGLEFSDGGYAAAVISIDFYKADKENSQEKHCSAEEIYDGSYKNNELLKLSVFDICRDTVGRNKYSTTFLNGNYIVCFFNIDNYEKDKAISRMTACLEEIRQIVLKYYGFSVTVGIGSICKEITGISYSYNEALTALDYRLILGSNRIIRIDDIEPRKKGVLVFDQLKEKQLVSIIKVGTMDEMTKEIKKLLDDMEISCVSLNDCQIYLLQILTVIIRTAAELKVDSDNIVSNNLSVFSDILKLNDSNEIFRWIITLCSNIKNCISTERQNSCKQIVDEATEYLNNSFSNPDITIDHLCGRLHISPAYFSTIFKKETKLTFVNYLTGVRMEAAKQLLRTTDYKTLDIARRVGFSEPNYFSYCFKRKFGVSPSQYRNNNL